MAAVNLLTAAQHIALIAVQACCKVPTRVPTHHSITSKIGVHTRMGLAQLTMHHACTDQAAQLEKRCISDSHPFRAHRALCTCTQALT